MAAAMNIGTRHTIFSGGIAASTARSASLMRVPGPLRRDQHMPLGGEIRRDGFEPEPRMPLLHDADIAFDPQRLPPHAFGEGRKRSHGEIDLSGFQPGFERLALRAPPRAGGHWAPPTISAFTSGGSSRIRPASTTQKLNVRCDTRGSNGTCSLRSLRMRSRISATGVAKLDRFRRRLHAQRHAHE